MDKNQTFIDLFFDGVQPQWAKELAEEFTKPYFIKILKTLKYKSESGQIFYPAVSNILRALKLVELDAVKILVLGQDPYFNEMQANGFAFAVNNGMTPPPSLKNIFKEIARDLKIPVPKNTSLEGWANQGILMLNSILTVDAGDPASHKNLGWQEFTDTIIKILNNRKDPIVFLLWGNFAQSKIPLITNPHHFILKSAHPSPFSAKNFLGCSHFSKTNQILKTLGKTPINWDQT